MSLFVLAGYTGSGKTEILCKLEHMGYQVINLEALASHNGSVFGHLTHRQTTSAYVFNKALLRKWKSFDLSGPVFCENKALRLGHIQIPDWLFQQMRHAPALWLDVKHEIRLQKILSLYGYTQPLDFYACISRLTKKLSYLQIQEIATHFSQGNVRQAFKILMQYYDAGAYYQKETYHITGEMQINEWQLNRITSELIRWAEAEKAETSAVQQ